MSDTVIGKFILKMGVAIAYGITHNCFEIGEYLLNSGCDYITDGGFWVWKYATDEVYYSPKFCNLLLYNHGDLGHGFDGFDKGDKKQMEHGIRLINELIKEKSEGVFVNDITFTNRNGVKIDIECSGSVFYKDGNPTYIIGTHQIKQQCQ